MDQKKSETLNLRVTPEFKRLLKLACDLEQRSQTNLLEKLLADHCVRAGVPSSVADPVAEHHNTAAMPNDLTHVRHYQQLQRRNRRAVRRVP